jgi:hypothetical protein
MGFYMDNDLTEYNNKVTDYIVERAIAEGSIFAYYEKNFCDKMSFREFIYNIAALHNELAFDDGSGKETLFTINTDEQEYISEKTGVSLEIVEYIEWFFECYMMRDDCYTWNVKCRECGHVELHQREVEGGDMNDIYLECIKCRKKYTPEDIEDSIDNLLPTIQYKEPDPLEGLNPEGLPVFTDKNAIYRFRVGRKIFELFGNETLADFSWEIQSMYDLDEEHMSSFYMGNKFFESNREIQCPRLSPFGEDKPTAAEKYEICNLNLYENQQFVYLHNYIRENRFNIRFIGTREKNS